MTKSKSPKPTVTKGPQIRNVPYSYENFLFYKEMKETFLPNTLVEKLCEEVYQWAEDDNWRDKNGKKALRWNQFLRMKGMNHETWDRLEEKYPRMRAVKEHAFRCFGDRRELGALDREFVEGTIARTLHYYCPIAKAAAQEAKDHEAAMVTARATAKAQAEGTDVKTINIYETPLPSEKE